MLAFCHHKRLICLSKYTASHLTITAGTANSHIVGELGSSPGGPVCIFLGGSWVFNVLGDGSLCTGT